MVKENDETVIDLGQMLTVLRKNIPRIIVWTVLGFVISLLILFIFIEPKYSATVDILVNQKNDNAQTQYTTQQADLSAVYTYEDVLKKSVILTPVLKIVKENDNYTGSLSDLTSSISIANETNSQIISVTVEDKDAYTASDIANTIGDVFKKKIVKMMKIDNVTIVSKATPSSNPVFPNKVLGILIGVVVGALIGIAIAIIRELTDKTVKSVEFLTDELELTSLGTVFHMEKNVGFHAVEIADNKSHENKNETYRRV
ncbi:chain-length determining protein [Ligilactobacillus sp. WILCCON 0076]|uniref:Capsular polysaccharide biosynthesis protein CpsC n=1 Tax=Ligilactobacillus ubinensis TaxID=2876789 RepID=A0A9X2FMZ8_9LACO|nr:Wzz/FepE/Etk N-terminal domain-containing protein [Ligilactobacillus ubinensis]MCP0888095.1 chain-length determining protein [Ligilactobacillus ubinensis]